jgi:L-ornithine Nalpha-acyltransferase
MFRLIVARSEREIADAQRVRFRVYCEEERLLPVEVAPDGRERDRRDGLESTTHLLVYAGAEPVGTVRLCLANAGSPEQPSGFGLDLEASFTLQGFERPGLRLAEITRYCVVRHLRGTRIAPALFAALREASQRLGVTHWVAAANMETDCAEDARIAHRLIETRALLSPAFAAVPRGGATPSLAKRFAYTPEERRHASRGELSHLKLPRTLSLFAHKLGGRYLGAPAYDEHFNVFAAPLAVDLAAIGVRVGHQTSRSVPLPASSAA